MASDQFKIEVKGDTAVVARFRRLSSVGHSAVRRAIISLANEDRNLVLHKLSGEVLNVKTGGLRRSIHYDVKDSGSVIVGRIFSSGDAKYAAIHEFGGTIHHPGGTAYMMIAGRPTFISNAVAAGGHIAGRTAPHDINMPERSFLRSALKEMQPRIAEKLRSAIREASKG